MNSEAKLQLPSASQDPAAPLWESSTRGAVESRHRCDRRAPTLFFP